MSNQSQQLLIEEARRRIEAFLYTTGGTALNVGWTVGQSFDPNLYLALIERLKREEARLKAARLALEAIAQGCGEDATDILSRAEQEINRLAA